LIVLPWGSNRKTGELISQLSGCEGKEGWFRWLKIHNPFYISKKTTIMGPNIQPKYVLRWGLMSY
jgi:hypothetical protein